MSSSLKEKAESVVAWVHRQPPMVNVALVIVAFIYIVSPIDLIPDFLIGPGQCDDAAMAWFGWQNVKALFHRNSILTVIAVDPEETNVR